MCLSTKQKRYPVFKRQQQQVQTVLKHVVAAVKVPQRLKVEPPFRLFHPRTCDSHHLWKGLYHRVAKRGSKARVTKCHAALGAGSGWAVGGGCCIFFSERCSMGFSHAEAKASVEHELVLCRCSYIFIHRLVCSFSALFFFFLTTWIWILATGNFTGFW